MTWADRIAEISNGIVIGLVVSMGSGIVWFFRWVFGISAQAKKNETQIKMMQKEIDERRESHKQERAEDREDLKEVKESLNVVTQHLLNHK